ncbi:MAG: hypothetical protein JWO86_5332 [Myxococcaceae bacterium]|jgi:hypothetical protein|nr:hypothetical protein [Myxococcaceae bacterium]
MKRMVATALLLLCAGAFASSLPACNKLQAAAAQDPMKCERDPKCDKKRGRTADCSRQCNDDPACMDRCEQVQQPNGALGH